MRLFLVYVNVAINFKNQAQFRAVEVNDEPPQQVLSPELEAKHPPITQKIPSPPLRERCLAPQLSRTVDLLA